MILTLLSAVMIIVGIVLLHLGINGSFKTDAGDGISFGVGAVSILIGAMVFIGCLIMIICNHTAVDKSIHDYDLQYESLVKQVEAVNSEYEDVSKATVINRVYKWNKDVYSNKYWAENPWTNWLYSKKIVDSLKYIDMEDTNAEDKTQTWISPRD